MRQNYRGDLDIRQISSGTNGYLINDQWCIAFYIQDQQQRYDEKKVQSRVPQGRVACRGCQIVGLLFRFLGSLQTKFRCSFSSGLKNDSMRETFRLRHTLNGQFFPIRFLRIVPIQGPYSVTVVRVHFTIEFIVVYWQKISQNSSCACHFLSLSTLLRGEN